jgi:hypothetical protein
LEKPKRQAFEELEAATMRIRRLALDVDKAMAAPTLFDIAEAIDKVTGVKAFNITVSEIDLETVGTNITVEGDDIDHRALVKAIEHTGARVHSVDELVAGDHIVERVQRAR